ncbi:MAG TPA: AAA family ATPase [Thermoplasmata archaeon]|nr:AAA family ATPase [Thermoplasmata archaeon]
MAARGSEAVWVEKYRPSSLKDMVGQDAILPLLRSYAEKRSMPHLLFAGPPGSGKTTAALALAKDLFGAEWRQSFMELNASVTGDTPILVRIQGEVQRTTIGVLSEKYFSTIGPGSVATPKLEVLSIDGALRIAYRPVSRLIRHRVSAVVRLAVEGGTLGVSLHHSVIVVDDDGRLVPKLAGDLEIGDLLLSFETTLPGSPVELDLAPYAPKREVWLPHDKRPTRNPTVGAVLDSIPLDDELAWALGDYAAEGCASPTRTSGNVVFTHAYPQEVEQTNRLSDTFQRYGFHTKTHTTRSGFGSKDGSHRLSAIQLTLASVQWMRFFRENFYNSSSNKTARTKSVPSFVFSAPLAERHAFLQGYAGDADGEWGTTLRYTSRSDSLLIDTAWLARISGIESAFKSGWGNTTLNWPKSATYCKSELLPVLPLARFVKRLGRSQIRGNWRYALRHALYDRRSPRSLKRTILEVLGGVSEKGLSPRDRAALNRWRSLARSDLHALRILSIRSEGSAQDVYDLTVPGSQAFWGGTVPLLLHNSDERGIDTVRTTIKQYARTSPLGDVGFKILFLDEADNLTSEAQASLRRLMERYSGSCRFILSCNYSSRIIDPIQSRCAVFRFRAYSPDAVRTQVKRIAAAEAKKVSAEALETILTASAGDMRRATNLLQLAGTHADSITAETIKEYATIPLRREVEGMLSAALAGNFRDARDRLFAMFVERGASGEDILKAIHSYLPDIPDTVLPAREKVRLLEYLGEVDFRLAQGASDRIQLEAVLAHVAASVPGGK